MNATLCPGCSAQLQLLNQPTRVCSFCGANLREIGDRLELVGTPRIVSRAEDATMRAAAIGAGGKVEITR